MDRGKVRYMERHDAALVFMIPAIPDEGMDIGLLLA